MKKRVIRTDAAPAAIGPYSQAVRAGGFLFLSGQIGLDPASGRVVDGGITAQVDRVMKNIEAVLKAAGSDLSQVVKTTLFLKSMDHFGTVNEIYAKYFAAEHPARSTVEVSRLPKDVLFEMEAVAYIP